MVPYFQTKDAKLEIILWHWVALICSCAGGGQPGGGGRGGGRGGRRGVGHEDQEHVLTLGGSYLLLCPLFMHDMRPLLSTPHTREYYAMHTVLKYFKYHSSIFYMYYIQILVLPTTCIPECSILWVLHILSIQNIHMQPPNAWHTNIFSILHVISHYIISE